jgi:hypothetical protein
MKPFQPGYVGPFNIGEGVFTVTFSEPIDPASSLVISVATTTTFGTTRVGLGSPTWLSSTTVQLTNLSPITATFPQGIYHYDIREARDYAGNKVTPPIPRRGPSNCAAPVPEPSPPCSRTRP